ncbi:MAG: hypothetical protein JKY71_08710 [Alphaproteobacteria bacterium]|nr:hypothetical protein [Alphaproteobacteria bacterium]
MGIKNKNWFLKLNRAYDSLAWHPLLVTPCFIFIVYRYLSQSEPALSTKLALGVVSLWFLMSIINQATDGSVAKWTNKSWGIEDNEDD